MRALVPTLLLLAACGTVDVQVDTVPCEDVVPSDPAELYLETDGADILAYRKPVIVGSADRFDPTFEFEGKELHIYEAWAVGDPDDTVCRMPTLRLVAPPSGRWIFNWYAESPSVPTHREDIEI